MAREAQLELGFTPASSRPWHSCARHGSTIKCYWRLAARPRVRAVPAGFWRQRNRAQRMLERVGATRQATSRQPKQTVHASRWQGAPPAARPHREQPPKHHLLHPRVDAAVELQPRPVQEESAAVVVGGGALIQVLLCSGWRREERRMSNRHESIAGTCNQPQPPRQRSEQQRLLASVQQARNMTTSLPNSRSLQRRARPRQQRSHHPPPSTPQHPVPL
jgi:hypothetical protein